MLPEFEEVTGPNVRGPLGRHVVWVGQARLHALDVGQQRLELILEEEGAQILAVL